MQLNKETKPNYSSIREKELETEYLAQYILIFLSNINKITKRLLRI